MSEFSINPYRFSADPPAMVQFLETLGLRRAVTSTGDWFGIMKAGAGWVAVHATAGAITEAQPGETQLVFLTESARVAAAELQENGVDATLWDESYGQHVGVIDPAGGGIWLNERQRDLYGYLGHDAHPDPRLSVVGLRPTHDVAEAKAFFAVFGFTADAGVSAGWTALSADETSGVLGLVEPTAGEQPWSLSPSPFSERTATVQLGFLTSEPLTELVARMSAAGYHAAVDAGDTRATLIDPDGCRIEVHSR